MSIEFTQSLKAEAKKLGFQLSGACPAVTPSGYSSFLEWLEGGYHGEMTYLDSRKDAYEHPKYVSDGCRSILMLGMSYHTGETQIEQSGYGRVAKYAWSAIDYHDLIHARLKALTRFAVEQRPDIKVRGVVDTAPLLEREFAQLAGIGWQAKNTMLINQAWGSWFFLAALLVDAELEYDDPMTQDHCGTCTACLEACPTDAFYEPGKLDATRCISYLTIEHRSSIDPNLRHGIGDWLFGCDVCQDVCPWNRKAKKTGIDQFQSLDWQNPIDVAQLFELDDDAFRQRFRKTPLWRSKRRGILRNAALVLGNSAEQGTIPAVFKGLQDHEPLVRGASAWALGRLGGDAALTALRQRADLESDPEVLQEIETAIGTAE